MEDEGDRLLINFLRYGMFIMIWIHTIVVLIFNTRELDRIGSHRKIPEELADHSFYTEDVFSQSKHYSYSIIALRTKSTFTQAIILTILLAFDVIPTVWIWLKPYAQMVLPDTEYPISHIALLTFSFGAIVTLCERVLFFLPELERFELEQEYGFLKKVGHGTFLGNYVKQLIFKIIAFPLLVIGFVLTLRELYRIVGEQGTWMHILALGILYYLILPFIIFLIFDITMNKHGIQRLPEGEIKTKIEALADIAGFPKDCIYVMLSTKTGSHSNAFHLRYFWYKRLVIYYSMFQKQNSDRGLKDNQMEAVVAHELGHFERGHGFWGVFCMQLILQLYILLHMWSLNSSWFYKAYAPSLMSLMPTDSLNQFVPGYLMVEMFYEKYFVQFCEFLFSHFQRHAELQADEYAVNLGHGKDLESALVKLACDNYAYPDHSDAYVYLNCTHPSILTRIRCIRSLMTTELKILNTKPSRT